MYIYIYDSLGVSGPRKSRWQKACRQIYAHRLHGYVSASARVASLGRFCHAS